MKWIYCLLFMIFLVSCERNRITQMSFEEDGIEITYVGSANTLNYTISCGNIILHTETFNIQHKGIYNLPLLQENTVIEKVDSLAYWITKNKEFKVNFTIRQDSIILVDSIRNYTYNPPTIRDSVYAELLSDKFGTIKWNDYSQYEKRAKTFLVENNEKANKSFVEKMAYNIYILLNKGKENQYTLSNIDTVKELPKSISVKTSMNARYFYLLAVKNEDEITKFAKTEIVDEFKQGHLNHTQEKNKLMQLSLIKPGIFNDLLYIFLLGIDEEWNYDYHLVGGIRLDNIGPNLEWESPIVNDILFQSFSIGQEKNISFTEKYTKFKDYYIRGGYSQANSSIRDITWGNFEGNNYFGYPITFYVNFNNIGDIDHLIIQGKKYPIKWDGIKGFVNKQFIFEHRFPRLNIGDNYISIKFVDKLGNTSTGKLNIATQSIRDNGIEINNSIYNDIN